MVYTTPAFGRAGGIATDTRSLLLNSLLNSLFQTNQRRFNACIHNVVHNIVIFTHSMQLEDHETRLNAGGKSQDLLYSHHPIWTTQDCT